MQRRSSYIAVAFMLSACTNDYDQFQYSSGGGPTGGASQGGQGGSTTTAPGGSDTGAGPTDGGGGAGPNGGGPSNGGGGQGGAVTTNGGGGAGGSSPTNSVPCAPPTTCDLDAGEICCFNQQNGMVSCDTSCSGQEAELACNGPQDCSDGDSCCFVFDMGDLQGTQCMPFCGGGSELCDPTDPTTCGNNSNCVDSQILPDGYFRCD